MLHIQDLTYRIGQRILLDKASANISKGWRVGLVGRNGTGKSTLFRLILGELEADGGSITLSGNPKIGTVAQEAPDGPENLLDTVLASDRERHALLEESTQADLSPQRVAEVHNRLAEIEAHSAPARAAGILAGLGFDHEAQQRPVGDYSGGWRMRVALAAALFQRPDLLLLDEPTNHLDLEAALWLETHLAGYDGTLIVISHERRLLNQVTRSILHLENGALNLYSGNYDRFERTRREKLVLQSKLAARQIEERQRIQAFVDRFRAKATKARQAQSRLKMLQRMEPIAAVIESEDVRFSFPQPDPLPPPLLNIENAVVGYSQDKPVLRRLNLRLDQDDRIGLIGANGNGKSTLIRLLAGELELSEGTVQKARSLRVGYFAQHQMEALDPHLTATQQMAKALPNAREPQVRAVLGRFGLPQERAETTIKLLSGGEKARLLLALATRNAPHLLLLDEPSNHLDMDAREALIQALNAFEGAVILVSHDPHLLEALCDRLWLVGDGTCTAFDGDLEDYARLLLDSARVGAGNGQEREEERGDVRKQARRDRADLRARQAPLRKAITDAEKRLEKLETEKTKLEQTLADPDLYDGPADKLQTLQIRLGEITKSIDTAEQAWLEAHQALEDFQ